MKLQFTIYFTVDKNVPPIYSLSEAQIARWAVIKKCRWSRASITRVISKSKIE